VARALSKIHSKEKVVKEKLESLVTEMIDRRIYLEEALNEFEKRFIQSALTKTGGNQTKAAQVLGVHRNTLNRKIVQYKLNGHR
jgi:DNA-binding NtrC family response regulator